MENGMDKLERKMGEKFHLVFPFPPFSSISVTHTFFPCSSPLSLFHAFALLFSLRLLSFFFQKSLITGEKKFVAEHGISDQFYLSGIQIAAGKKVNCNQIVARKKIELQLPVSGLNSKRP